MTVTDMPRSEWRSLLEDFSRAHRAWVGTIHGFVGNAPVTYIPSVALESVVLEGGASGPILRITFINGVSLCAVRPCVVRVQTDDGGERALEVETADGGFIRLGFRATALPEQLDGLAPGELFPEASTWRSRRRGSIAARTTELGDADSAVSSG
jgi:hypothetical protein